MVIVQFQAGSPLLMRIKYSWDVDIDVVAAPEIQKLCSVSEWCVVVVLMINKGLLSPGKDLTVDPRSISYLRNCV